jgi:hypothetical protein
VKHSAADADDLSRRLAGLRLIGSLKDASAWSACRPRWAESPGPRRTPR